MKKIKKEIIDLIIQEYQEGKSLRFIVRKYKIGIGTTHKYTKQEGIVRKHNIIEKVQSKDERLIGVYIGLWMGDGTQYPDKGYTIKICGNKLDLRLNEFIQQTIYNLFGKTSRIYKVSNTNQAWVIFKSKFIYDFVYNYITQLYKQKTYTVQLKCGVEKYSDDFLEGYLLGLALSDGYLKNKFYFNVTSKKLSINMIDILIRFGYTPRAYILKREKYGWKDLHMVRLISSETRNLNEFLDEILKRLSCAYTFKELKYENIEMGTA